MTNDKDKLFEKIFFLWKGEGEKRNQSIDWFCDRYGANVEEYRKWFIGISKSVKEILVVGRPGEPYASDNRPGHFYLFRGAQTLDTATASWLR